jgi:thiol-disulfide isomerase/thioredoxin
MTTTDPETTQRRKGAQLAIATAISALIIGSAVLLAFLVGDSGDPATVATGEAPTTVDYVNYADPEALLAGHAGRPLVINFFASYCVSCRVELPGLAAAHATYGDRVDFVGVDYQELSERLAAELLWQTGVKYQIMEDPKGVLLQELGGLPVLPVTIFVAADSEIIERHAGLILSQQLTERIEEIIALS